MATIRMTENQFREIYDHLYSTEGEHFAFMLANWTTSREEPIFSVREIIPIHDRDVSTGHNGWEVDLSALINAINKAQHTSLALIEVHNHGGKSPRFSSTDRTGLRQFVPYVIDSLKTRPYAATVWGEDSVYGEYFMPNGATGMFSSFTVRGIALRQLVSRHDDDKTVDQYFNRQLPWFTEAGQRSLRRIRVGLIGLGGTGSVIAQCLAYLGFEDFVLVDDDRAEHTNLNRLVTAFPADIETPKAVLARRLIRTIRPHASAIAIEQNLRAQQALDILKGVDILVGCVDNDGARLILNEISVAYEIPYFDVATGIDAEDGNLASAGGRLAIVLPGGPCLYCMDEIDPKEAAYFLATREHQDWQKQRGYVEGMDVKAPSVVSLNTTIAGMACNELAIYVTSGRAINVYTELDLIGNGRKVKSQWTTPRVVTKKNGCIQCSLAGQGDRTKLERYYYSQRVF